MPSIPLRGLLQIRAQLVDRRPHARQVRSHRAAEADADLFDNLERLGASRSAGAVRARNEVRAKGPQLLDVMEQLLLARGRLGRKQLERQAELAGAIGLRNMHDERHHRNV